jgi:hypothetical protein
MCTPEQKKLNSSPPLGSKGGFKGRNQTRCAAVHVCSMLQQQLHHL